MSNRTPPNLDNEQRRLFDMYIDHYTQINNQAETLNTLMININNNIINSIRCLLNANSLINIQSNNNRQHNNNNNNNNNNRQYNNNNNNNRPHNNNNNRQHNNRQHNNNNNNRQHNIRQHNIRQHNNRTPVLYDYTTPINPLIYANANANNTRNLINTFFNDIPIRPTQQHINDSSRIIRYGDITNPISEACPISLEHFNDNDNIRQIHHCGHIFSQDAFNQWFSINVRCPVCRYDIRNNNSIESGAIHQLTNTMLNAVNSILHNSNSQSIDTLLFDPSNNIVLFETIMHPNSEI
jgi:hypothetical protein